MLARASDEVWKLSGLCRQVDLELWFPESGEDPQPAQRVCASCPVVARCLEWALDHDEQHGIWGGLTANGRRALVRGGPRPKPVTALREKSMVACDCGCGQTVRPGTRRQHRRVQAGRARVAA